MDSVTSRNFLTSLPLVPGPYVSQGGEPPWRPILHLFAGELVVQLEYYELSPRGYNISLGVGTYFGAPTDDNFQAGLVAYLHEVSRYHATLLAGGTLYGRSR